MGVVRTFAGGKQGILEATRSLEAETARVVLIGLGGLEVAQLLCLFVNVHTRPVALQHLHLDFADAKRITGLHLPLSFVLVGAAAVAHHLPHGMIDTLDTTLGR